MTHEEEHFALSAGAFGRLATRRSRYDWGTHVSLSNALAGVSPRITRSFFFARLPRVLLALVAGAALSVTGVLFQCMLRDPLAEPQYTLGVSASGSSVGTVIAISPQIWRLSVLPAIQGAKGAMLAD